MRLKIEKSLKRWLKKKVTITLGVIVTFMITGGVAYSNDDVINKGVIIKVDDNGKIVAEINGEQTEIGNSWTNNGKIDVAKGNGIVIKKGITAEKNFSLTNNGVISGNSIDGGDYSGNGVYLERDSTLENLINNGVISGNSTNGGRISGNGVFLGGILKNLINNGEISGNSIEGEEYSGNGVIFLRGDSTLTNNGVISGNSTNGEENSGNGVYIGEDSTLKNLTNNGVISGNSIKGGRISGNGVYIWKDSTLKNLTNNGIILGNSTNGGRISGNGVFSNGILKNLTNNGVISGSTNGGWDSGIGAYIGWSGTLTNNGEISGNSTGGGINSGIGIAIGGTLTNNGEISGNSIKGEAYSGNGVYIGADSTLINNGAISGNSINGEVYSGNGVYIEDNRTLNLTNNGIISGNSTDIGINSGNGVYIGWESTLNLTNYGIIAGSNKAISKGQGSQNNYGLLIDGAGTDNVKVNAGAGGKVEDIGYTIMNTFNEGEVTNINSEKEIRLEDNNNSNLIINGYNKGLTVHKDLTLSNSIINSYTTAINIESGNFTGNNIIVNGGADNKYDEKGEIISQSPTIKGSEKEDNLTLTGNSIINGNIDLGAGDDNLTISNSVQINGNLSGGDGEDTLTFNNSTSNEEKNINIFNDINGFENINIDTNVTFFEGSKVEGVEKIDISSDGRLSLRLEKNENGKATHSLSGNNVVIKGETEGEKKGDKTGNLQFITNGMGTGTIIDMSGISLDNVFVDTNSIIDRFKWNEDKDLILDVEGDLSGVISSESSLPENIKYENLNSVYQSIVSTNSDENINKLKEVIGSTSNLEDNEQNKHLVNYLSSIYAGTPYSYSTEISRKTLTMFDEIAISKDLNPDLKSWAIYGGLTYTDGGTENTFYGKNYYGFDSKNMIIDADTKISGGYAKAEYGKTENFTTGIIFGGNNSEVSLSNGSKLEGDSFYFGIYGKQKLGNLKLTAGIGLQHGDYKADRVSGGYISTRNSENYHDRGFNIYLDGRYSYGLGNNFFLEPRMTVDYNRIQQDEVSESGVLGIEVDSKIFETVSGTVGLDIKKVIPTENLTHELTLGVSYNTFFKGDKEEYLTGRFVGGSNFDMLVSEKADTLSLNGKYEVITEKGFTFDVRGNYSFEHENVKEELTVGAGIGYKF